MGFLRRGKPEPRMGIRIDLRDYQMQILEGTRPGLPFDGRYWVVLIENHGEVDRLVWEQAATYQEVKALLKDFQKTYRKRPVSISEVRTDDVVGTWVITGTKKPDAMLSVTHPIVLQRNAWKWER